MKKLTILDTFSGIGGFSYAAERLVGGFETTQFVENNPYCQKILKKHWPNVPIHDDIKTYTAKPFQFDVLCGGFPCQDLSVGGQRQGITPETRSGLFFELVRIIRLVRPRYILLENVSALLNFGMDIVLGELSEAGYDCEWSVISAEQRGACHKRERIWIIAYPKHNGLFTAERIGFNDKTDSDTQKGSKKIRESKGSSKPRDSRTFQQVTESTDPMFKGLQGRRGKSKLQKDSGERQIIWRSQPHLLNPDWKGYVSEPTVRRGNDGLSNRVDRLRALGNSIVPAVATIPLGRILDLEKNDY
tara:strand:- start:15644 stop:16549 length:906 start_codon:yes stop_codon:yes gene_type:complete